MKKILLVILATTLAAIAACSRTPNQVLTRQQATEIRQLAEQVKDALPVTAPNMNLIIMRAEQIEASN